MHRLYAMCCSPSRPIVAVEASIPHILGAVQAHGVVRAAVHPRPSLTIL